MRVLLVGVSTRALAQSALKAGLNIIAVDYFGDLDQRLIIPSLAVGRDFGLPFSEESIVKVCSLIEYDAVIYTGGADIKPSLIHFISKGKLLLGNDSEVLRDIRNPITLRDACRTMGINFPTTLLPDETSNMDLNERWLMKPVYGGSGFGIRFYEGEELGEGFYIQKFMSGLPASASFLSDGKGCRLLGMTRQLIGDELLGGSGFKWCGNVFPLSPAFAGLADVISQWGEKMVGHFGLKGLFGIDFILGGDERPCLVEINPRYTASMELIEPYVNMPLLALHKLACEGKLEEVSLVNTSEFVSKGIVYAKADSVTPDTSSWLGVHADVPFPGESIPNGSPVCSVFGKGISEGGCLFHLHERANEVYRELRSDDCHERRKD